MVSRPAYARVARCARRGNRGRDVSDLRELLRALSETLMLDPIDVQLAGVLTRRTNATGDQAIALALGAALTSRAVREGHSAITIEQLSVQTREMRWQLGDGALSVPAEPEDSWWVRMLGSCTDVVGEGMGLTPLVLNDRMLQFRRYYDAESRIAEHVRRSLQVKGNPPAF